MILLKLIPFFLTVMLGFWLIFESKQSKYMFFYIFGWIALFMVVQYFTFTL